MTRQVTDQLYIDLGYYNPEEYYTYEASAESALASEFSLAATISHIEGVDIVASSFATVDVSGDKIRTAAASLTSEFSLIASSSGIEEFSAALTSAGSIEITVTKISDATVSLTSEFTQSTQAERFIQIDTALTSAVTQISNIEVTRGFGVGLSSDADCACVNYRVREQACDAGALFNVAIAATATINSFAILDSVSTVTADVDRLLGENTASLESAVLISVQVESYTDNQISISAAFAFSISETVFKGTSLSLTSTSTLTTLPEVILLVLDNGYMKITADDLDIIGRPTPKFGTGGPLFIDRWFSSDNKVGVLYTAADSEDIYDFANSPWTIEFWFRDLSDSVYNQSPLMVLYDSSNNAKITLNTQSTSSGDGTNRLIIGGVITNITDVNYAVNQWHHIAVVKSGNAIRAYLNGTRFNSSGPGTGFGTPTRLRFSNNTAVGQNPSHYIDELRILNSARSTGTTISVPTTEFARSRNNIGLYHFETYTSGYSDRTSSDSYVRDAVANFTSTASITATLSGLSKVSAALNSQGFVVSVAVKKVDEFADLSSTLTLSCNAGKQLSASSNQAVTGTLTATVFRTKRFTSTISGALSISVTTKIFEGFALLTLPAQATLSATARLNKGNLRSTINSVSTLSATGFEAEKDPAPVVIPRTNRVLYHFDTYQPPESPTDQQYTTDSYNSDLKLYGSELVSSTFFNEQTKFGTNAWMTPSLVNFGVTIPEGQKGRNLAAPNIGTGNFTFDFWFKPFSYFSISYSNPPLTNYLFRWLNSDYTNYSYLLYYEHNPGTDELRLILIDQQTGNSYSTTSEWLGDRGAVSSTTGYRAYLYNNWIHIALQRNGNVKTLWVDGVEKITFTSTNQNLSNRILFDLRDDGAGTYYGTTAVFDELRIVPYSSYSGTFTPPTQAYTVETDLYTEKNGYALIEPRFNLSVIITQNAQANLNSAFTISASGGRIRTSASNLTVTASQTATIGKLANIVSNLSSQVVQSTQARRTRTTASSLSSVATQSTVNQRLRFAQSQITVTSTVTASGDRTRLLTSAITSNASVNTVGQRIRYFNTEFDSIATQLTAAGYNATGTVLLESRFDSSVQAQKTTDVVSNVVIVTDFTVLNDRFREVTSNQTVTATLGCDALNIRPAGSAMAVTASMSINTDNSRIVGITSNNNSEFTQTTVNEILRLAVAALSANTTISILAFKVKQFNIAVTSQASIQILTGIRADARANLPSIATQLSVVDVINIDPFYQIKVEAESRQGTVRPENRVIQVEQETRLNMIL